ncbi:MAG TPA: formate dehydrogenase subunit gamma [Usitatibacter sp.]|nr:formate dehydrogenase subunit gamma [Usitatibacter sp.]
MLKARPRLWGALLVGAALALPLVVAAQAPASNTTTAAPAAASPAPPTTAPTRNAGKVPDAPAVTTDAPKASSPPTPQKGSTAVPGWNNPPSWGNASERPAYASVPGVDTNRLIQGAGREWRAFRNGPLTRYGGWIIVGMLAVIVLFYLIKGAIKLHGQPTGRLIERFNAVERAAHWTMAISFVFLAISGIVILWGKHIILPWLGYTGFSWLTIVSKNIHNFVGPLFIFSIVVMFLIYVKDNLISSRDITWVARLGGMFSKEEVPSGRFNGGEKLWFWGGMVLLGTIMSVTGLILDFPNWNQGREVMQQANVIHAIAAVLFIAGSFAHIYIGTIGMEGAYRGMRDGYVDETWAREHHALWYEEVKQGKRPEKMVAGRVQPAPGDD